MFMMLIGWPWFSKESEEVKENEPFMSILVEATELVRDDFLSLEEENLPILTEKERFPFSTGTTLDEFELVAKALQEVSRLQKKRK
jgi:hypothetical protein